MRFFPHVILLMIIFSSPPDAKIIESVPTMRDVKFKVEEALQKTKPEDVLVAFDIDMTLTQPDHPAVYYPTIIKYRKTYKEITEPLSNEQHDLLLDTVIKYQRSHYPSFFETSNKRTLSMI